MKVRLLVAYHGGGFRGFARNDGVPTVQGALEQAMGQVCGVPVPTVGAGRTDAGVHAWGQVVSAEVPDGTDPERLQRSLNAMLAPAVVVREATVATADFDARNGAQWRAYRYTIVNRSVPDPFLVGVAWWVHQPLDLRALRLAADPFIGDHDFSSFCRRPPPLADGRLRSLRRTVLDARWHDRGEGVLRFDIRATSFCHQMVRALVGHMVEVGTGRRRAGEVRATLAARDRSVAGPVAPPDGLCLWEVGY